jgi:hypothetical protein
MQNVLHGLILYTLKLSTQCDIPLNICSYTNHPLTMKKVLKNKSLKNLLYLQ